MLQKESTRSDGASDRASTQQESKQRTQRKSGKKASSGPSVRLLSDTERARLEAIQRDGAGLRSAWASFRIYTDDTRRRNLAVRGESVTEDGFDRGTSALTDHGYVGP